MDDRAVRRGVRLSAHLLRGIFERQAGGNGPRFPPYHPGRDCRAACGWDRHLVKERRGTPDVPPPDSVFVPCPARIVSTLENRYTTDFQNSGCAAVGKARALTMKSDAGPLCGLCGTGVPHKLKRSVHFFLTASIIKDLLRLPGTGGGLLRLRPEGRAPLPGRYAVPL